jgi:hypothetical protein
VPWRKESRLRQIVSGVYALETRSGSLPDISVYSAFVSLEVTYCVFHRSCAALTFLRAVSAVNGGLMSAMIAMMPT